MKENSDKVKRAIKLATKEILNMSDEEFKKKWDESYQIKHESILGSESVVRDREYLRNLLTKDKKIDIEDFAYIILANLFDSDGNAKDVELKNSELRDLACDNLKEFSNIMQELNSGK